MVQGTVQSKKDPTGDGALSLSLIGLWAFVALVLIVSVFQWRAIGACVQAAFGAIK